MAILNQVWFFTKLPWKDEELSSSLGLLIAMGRRDILPGSQKGQRVQWLGLGLLKQTAWVCNPFLPLITYAASGILLNLSVPPFHLVSKNTYTTNLTGFFEDEITHLKQLSQGLCIESTLSAIIMIAILLLSFTAFSGQSHGSNTGRNPIELCHSIFFSGPRWYRGQPWV